MVERRVVHYSGRVQGVGFRYTTRRIAGAYQVAGWVKNLSDGRVELVVEGESGDLDRFLDEVQIAMGATINDRRVQVQEAQGLSSGFSIRF